MIRRGAGGVISVAAILLVFFAVRMPLLIEPGIWFGWHGDAGILGVMAKRMAEGRGFDFFFLGQNWIGPLTSLLAAAIAKVGGLFGLPPHVGPLSLRLSFFLQVLAGIIFIWLALRKHRNPAATLTALFLAIGPPLLIPSVGTAVAPEMVWSMGGLIIWFGASEWRGRSHPLIFGLLTGLLLWMNQSGIFVIAGVAAALILESEWWRSRPPLRVRDHLMFRGFTRRTRVLLLTLQGLLLADLAYLIVRDLTGAPLPLPGFRWPYGEPLALLIAMHVGASVAQRERWLTRSQRNALAGYLLWMGIGFLIGYGPVMLGRIFDWYPLGYTFGLRLTYPDEALRKVQYIFTSAFDTLYGNLDAAILALTLAAMVRLRRRWPTDRATVIILATAVANLVYTVLIFQSGKEHYLTASIPAAWLIAAIGVVDLWKSRPWLAGIAAAALFLSLGFGAAQKVSQSLAEPDPRSVIAAIHRQGCAVCYAEYWTAYKYRFLTNEAFAFIPYQTQDRSPEDSARYRQLPGKRCLILPDGTVVPRPPDIQ